jgi:crotonobetainyl-CoA:carnitine CoA-transferase CaiB-like acyl-CoA transferase
MIQTINLSSGKTLKVPAVLPKLSGTPGQTGGAGPALGEHTDEVLSAIGIDDETIKRLRQRGVIAGGKGGL